MRRRKTRSRSDVEVEKLALTGNVNCAEIFQTLRRTQARAMLPGVLLTSLVLSEVVHFAFSLLASPLILYYTHLFSPTTAFITVSAKFKPRPSSYTYRFIYIYILWYIASLDTCAVHCEYAMRNLSLLHRYHFRHVCD